MKTLLILRHAATAKASPGGTDFDRPLTAQGVLEAQAQGRWMKEAGLAPALIFASSAVRARETAEALAEALGHSGVLSLADALYNAHGPDLLRAVQALEAPADEVLLIAHFPGVAELLAMLVSESADVALVCETGTLAAVRLDCTTWAEAAPATGVLHLLMPPQVATPG